MPRRSERALRKRKKKTVGGRRAKTRTHAPEPRYWRGKDQPQRMLFYNLVGGAAFTGKVLDLGCQDGIDAVFLAKKGLSVTAVDEDANTVAAAKQRALRARVSVDFSVARLHELPYADACFDAVYSKLQIKRTYPKKALSEIARVLKPQGLAYLVIGPKTKDFKRQRSAELLMKKALIYEYINKPAFMGAARDKFDIVHAEAYEVVAKKPVTAHKHANLILVLRKR